MMGLDITFDGLDELSERYADTQYGLDSEKYGADTYVIIDGDISADGIVYTLNFALDINNLHLNIVSSGWKLLHHMGDDYNSSVAVTIPTEVREQENELILNSIQHYFGHLGIETVERISICQADALTDLLQKHQKGIGRIFELGKHIGEANG